MKQTLWIIIVASVFLASARLVQAACDAEVKQGIVARMAQDPNPCEAADEHCRVIKHINFLTNQGIYGTETGYLRQIQQCMQADAAECKLPDGAVINPAHEFVLFTPATDASYVAAGGQPDLATASSVYQCVSELLMDLLTVRNVYELAKAEIPPPQQQANPNPPQNNAPPVALGMQCQSAIFDCDKPLAFYQLPIGSYCKADVIHTGKKDQIMLVSGLDALVVMDLRTLKAVACKDVKESCEDPFVTLGKNEDGSTHLTVIDNGVLVNPASTFQKMLVTAKPLMTVVSQPVTDTCDEVFKDAKTEFEKNAYPIPNTESVVVNGQNVATEVVQGALHGNGALLVLQNKVAQTVMGLGIMSLGDSAVTSKMIFKPFPAEVLATPYVKSRSVAILSADAAHLKALVSLSSVEKGDDALECDVPLDETTPIQCNLKVSGGIAGAEPFIKTIISSVLKQKAAEKFSSGEFGEKLGEIIATDPAVDINKLSNFLMHGFEGFGNVPNALLVDVAGIRLFRQGSDDNVAQDAAEILPGATNGCVLADVDHYAGKDLVCFSGNVVSLIPKRNLPPKIEELKLSPAADHQKAKGQAVTKTQEDEDLTYKWQVFEYKDGKLSERPDLVTNATTPEPTLNFPTDSVATSVESLTPPVAGGDTDAAKTSVNVNASLAKSAKSSGDGSQPVYFVALTATDPGGLSATSYGAISKSVGAGTTAPGGEGNTGGAQPASPLAATTPAGGSLFAMEGGFGCALHPVNVRPVSILILVLLAFPALVMIPARVWVRHRCK